GPNSSAFSKLSDLPFNCGNQPQVIQNRRPQIGCDPADALNRIIDVGNHRVHLLSDLSGPASFGTNPCEIQLESRQGLTQLVVYLTRHPSALFLTDSLQSCGEVTQLLAGRSKRLFRPFMLGDLTNHYCCCCCSYGVSRRPTGSMRRAETEAIPTFVMAPGSWNFANRSFVISERLIQASNHF